MAVSLRLIEDKVLPSGSSISYLGDSTGSRYAISTGQLGCGKYDDTLYSIHHPADVAFKEGLKIFKNHLTNDESKKRLADDFLSSRVEDVVKIVADSVAHYQDKRSSSAIRDSLTAFSSRLMYYGNIVDVLVQHNPEYVALVWGAMKLLFGAVLEHERTGTTIVTALSDIADVLPRIELMVSIYPTATIKKAASVLYAHIVRFLVRAWKYYTESSLLRAVHSITRPAALRYDDIVKMIQRDTQNITNHSVAACQAEIRDIHHEIRAIQSHAENESTRNTRNGAQLQNKVDALMSMVTQLQQTIVLEKGARATSQLHIEAVLSEMQLTQAIAMVSSQCAIDHKFVFTSNSQLHGRRRLREPLRQGSGPLWKATQLQQWNESSASSAILLKPAIRERSRVEGFCIEVIEQLVTKKTAVLWVLAGRGEPYPLLEVFKSLVLQTLSLDTWSSCESKMSFQIKRFTAAYSADDYIDMLRDILQHFKLVYIIANSEAMSQPTTLQYRNCLHRLSRELLEGGSKTILKVITAAHGPVSATQSQPEDFVVTIGRTHKHEMRRQMKGRSRKQPMVLRH